MPDGLRVCFKKIAKGITVKKVYVFLADGFEEIEAITPVDFLRRAGADVNLVSLFEKDTMVVGAHGISIKADISAGGFVLPPDAEMLVFPGGGGVELLRQSSFIRQVLEEAVNRGIYIAAICAAPLLLQDNKLLQGKNVTAFPAVQSKISGANVTGQPVEVQGNFITARSAGVALQFAHVLCAKLLGEAAANKVLESLYP